MDNLMLLAEASDNLPTESAQSVSEMVQTVSSRGLRLIGFTLIIMMVILALLTITLIMIELRQDTLRNTIYMMAKRLERIEKAMNATELQEDIEKASSYKKAVANTNKRNSPRSSNSSTHTRYNNSAGNYDSERRTSTFHIPDLSKETEYVDYNNESCEVMGVDPFTGTTFASSGPSTTQDANVESYPVTGLRINTSSYYNQNMPARFDEIDIADAFLILYSDMSIHPHERLFKTYNRAAFYTGHDFTKVYDFQDMEGDLLDINHTKNMLRCLSIEVPATVINSQNGYILNEKGIILAEER